MDKILVEVYVPVVEASWDMFIPREAKMYEVLDMIKTAVSDLSGGRFLADENTAVCYRQNGMILNINLSVKELGLKNAAKLMLI
ncbi:MAG: methyltransferase [bacterium]|nr:methyltransferase [bacterium]MCM1499969.1 methyltransferase [Clostridium sp.]